MTVGVSHARDDESDVLRALALIVADAAHAPVGDRPRASDPLRARARILGPQADAGDEHGSELAEHALDVVR